MNQNRREFIASVFAGVGAGSVAPASAAPVAATATHAILLPVIVHMYKHEADGLTPMDIRDFVGKKNTRPWRGFAAGELLFEGGEFKRMEDGRWIGDLSIKHFEDLRGSHPLDLLYYDSVDFNTLSIGKRFCHRWSYHVMDQRLLG